MKTGKIMMIAGLVILAAGVVLSLMEIKEWANYALITGFVLAVLSGSFRMRGK